MAHPPPPFPPTLPKHAPPFPPPTPPPGMKLPRGIVIENGRPKARWGDIADMPVPGSENDLVSLLLKRIRVSAILTGESVGCGRFGAQLPPIPCAYMVVFEGRLFLSTQPASAPFGHPLHTDLGVHTDPIELNAGDAALICQPAHVTIASDRDAPVRSIFELLASSDGAPIGPTPSGPLPSTMRPVGFRLGSGGPDAPVTRFMGGPMLFDSGVGGPLRSALPPRLVLRGTDGVHGVAGLIELLRREAASRGPGAQAMADQVVTMLFIEAARGFLRDIERGGPRPAWAGALFDEHLGPMLALLHASPARGWTLEDMANEAGLSRTVFVQRFQELVGVPPATYVREYRMEIARDLLKTSTVEVRAIAARVGYSTEPAFCKVFKKWCGFTPGEVRAGADGPRPR